MLVFRAAFLGAFAVSRGRGRECAERLSVAFDNFGWLREQGLSEGGRPMKLLVWVGSLKELTLEIRMNQE